MSIRDSIRFRDKKEPVEHIRVVDPAVDHKGQPISSYWEGRMPLEELLKADPEARCRTTEIPKDRRRLAWYGSPGLFGLLLFATTYLTTLADSPADNLPMAAAIGVFFGAPVGLAVAWLVVRWFLQPSAWWHFMRFRRADAVQLGFTPREESDAFVVVGISPPPLMANIEDAGEELDKETKALIWWYEMLGLGENGWSTKRYLTAIGASRMREEAIKGNGARPSLEARTPDNRGNPSG